MTPILLTVLPVAETASSTGSCGFLPELKDEVESGGRDEVAPKGFPGERKGIHRSGFIEVVVGKDCRTR